MGAALLRSVALAVAIGVAAAPISGAAAENAHRLAGQLVPLPEGQWHVLAQTEDDLTLRGAPRPARITAMAAALVRDDQVVAMVVARGNATPVRGAFGLTETCRRSDFHFHRNDTPRGSLTGSCQYVGHAVQDVGPGSAVVWIEAVAAVRQRRWKLPITWLIAGYRIADAQDMLDVRYLFNPEIFGISDDGATAAMAGAPTPMQGWFDRTWEAAASAVGFAPLPHDPRWIASSWAVNHIEPNSQRELLVRHLVHWAEAAQPAVHLGFKNRTHGTLAMPRAWTGQRILPRGSRTDPPTEADPAPSEERALWKTLTWRSVGSGLDALVAYVLTGSPGVAGAITVVGGAVNATAYYVHELVWEAMGADGGPGDRLTELPAVAVIR